MSNSTITPAASPAVQKVLRSRDPTNELLSELRALALDQPKLVKATSYTVPPSRPGSPSATHEQHPPPTTITSWKMLEHLYRTSPCPFPTLARGMFTAWSSESGAPEPPCRPADAKGKTKEERRNEEEKGDWRIVARGYDKFFNVGEVGWTEWRALTQNTTGPYELTLKSNGCLILVAALTPSRLLVTSKHSLGTRRDPSKAPADPVATDPDKAHDGPLETSHAERGEQWLLKHLKDSGKSESALAKVLWEKNVSAVAELCDDSFEEHVLPIPAELTGLVLHGLVPNQPAFESLPAGEVVQFAEEWGFKPTHIVSLNSVAEVRAFCAEGAKKGEWEGVGVEGWVVRCRVRDPSSSPTSPSSEKDAELDDIEVANLVRSDPGDAPVHKDKKPDKQGRRTSTPPYPPDAPFFFKVKFEEPYLMYREWRELTKTMLPVMDGKQVEGDIQIKGAAELRFKGAASKNVKDKTKISIPDRFKKRPETRVYLAWLLPQLRKRPAPAMFKNYAYNRGIIEVREKFLEWAQGEGKAVWEREVGKGAKSVVKDLEREGGCENAKPKEDKQWKKTVIVPVAVPGCGKTSVAVALTKLFGFGHTQSDDVKGKKSTGPQFVKNVVGLLDKHDVVFADRNNHLVQHRTQIREAVANHPKGPVRLLGMHWSLSVVPVPTIHRLMSSRLLARGENHQSLRAKPDDIKFHEDVLWQFLGKAEPLDPDELEDGGVMEMDVREGLEETVRRAVKSVVKELGLEMPVEEKIKEAVEAARAHKAGEKTKDDVKKDAGKKARYYAVLAELDLAQVVGATLEGAEGAGMPEMKEFWKKLVDGNRVNKRPHITVAHSSDPPSAEGTRVWEECMGVAARPEAPLYEFTITHIVCNGRVMACAVDPASVRMREVEGAPNPGRDDDVDWGKERMKVLHITVGTKSQDIGNVEGGKLIKEWREGRKDGVWVRQLREQGVGVLGILKAMYY